MSKLGAKAEVEGAAAGSAIDGDPTTFILVGDQRAPAREQVELHDYISRAGGNVGSGVDVAAESSRA